jgi:hypothetical protein
MHREQDDGDGQARILTARATARPSLRGMSTSSTATRGTSRWMLS